MFVTAKRNEGAIINICKYVGGGGFVCTLIFNPLLPSSPTDSKCIYQPFAPLVSGHFTAMVWKSTKEMGIGKATASDGSSFVVARYSPAGNITNQGHFENNVLPAK